MATQHENQFEALKRAMGKEKVHSDLQQIPSVWIDSALWTTQRDVRLREELPRGPPSRRASVYENPDRGTFPARGPLECLLEFQRDFCFMKTSLETKTSLVLRSHQGC